MLDLMVAGIRELKVKGRTESREGANGEEW